MPPLVTVIIPAHNVEEFLAEAVASVLEQTYQNIELIIVNDASTDHTGALADKLSTKDSRVRVTHHPENKFRSGALNTGIQQAKGAYISFLDADDRYLPDKTAAQVAFLEVHSDAAMVYGDFLLDHGTYKPQQEVTAILSADDVYERLVSAACGGSLSIFVDGYIPSCSPLIRANTFGHIRLDETLKNMEDLDLWLQMLGARFVVTRLPTLTYTYRLHENQKSRDTERMRAALAVIEEKIRAGVYLRNTLN